MTNLLQQVNEAIIKDPHGCVARHASHWLAVEVMGEEFAARIVFENDWQPFTNANHTYGLVRKVGIVEYRGQDILGDAYPEEYAPIFPVSQYDGDTTHDARQVLNKCHAEETLTDEILKGWLEND